MPRACPVEYYARRYIADLTHTCLDATGLSRGGSRSLLNSRKRDAPPDKPVDSEHLLPWNSGSCTHETPRGEPVVSSTLCAKPRQSRSVGFTSPWTNRVL